MTPNDEARLVLLAAVALLRDGELDNYVVARLEQAGYTRAHVQTMAVWLVEDAQTALDSHRRPQVAA